MTSDDVTNIGYWIDKIVKIMIGVVIAVAGFEYRNVKSSLDDLQEKKHIVLAEIASIKTLLPSIEKRVERIDDKTDRILERLK